MSEIVKIVFPLCVDEDGFPPISSESMHAQPDGHCFVIENTPFFVMGVALGDRVYATPMSDQRNCYTFDTVALASGHKAVSVILLNSGIRNAVYQELKKRGCYCEYGEFGRGGILQMLAVSVPVDCEYEGIARYLAELEEQDQLSYAELAV